MSKRRVLVTGASKGIGKAVAVQLGKDGFDISIHYHSDESGAAETLAQILSADGSGRLLQFDVADRAATRAALAADLSEQGPYYGIVSNAGLVRDNTFVALSEADWDTVINTNLDSFYNVIQPCVMPMVRAKEGGRIVTISSVSGMMGNRGQVNYSASKAGIIGATKALAMELASRNITVNCVAPGLIDTGMVTEEQFGHAKDLIPMGRMGRPDEISGLVSYLFSDSASYLTRQVISVNGGLL